MTETNGNSHNVRRPRRSRSDKTLAGVCGGWAQYLGVDSSLLRILFLIAAVLGVGTPVLIYLICWVVMPEE
jgi:phage shock protein PspC (stress-responsive transcriptional regulator)